MSSHVIRRRWLRFSVRSLILLIGVFAIWLATIVNRVHHQRQVVASVLSLGGRVTYAWEPELHTRSFLPAPIEGFPGEATYGEPTGPTWLRRWLGDDFFWHVVEVHIAADRWSKKVIELDPTTMRRIATLPRLQTLALIRTTLSDADLIQLGTIKNLRTLVIRNNEISDAGLMHLLSLDHLNQINVIETEVTPKGIAKFKQHRPNCLIHLREPPRLMRLPFGDYPPIPLK